MTSEGSDFTAREVVKGAVFSDGFISRHKLGTNSYFSLMLSGKTHSDWLHSVKLALLEIGIGVSGRYPYVFPVVKRGRNYDYCLLRSRNDCRLNAMRDVWYPSGRKAVPRGFTFSSVSLANVFMGDGSSSVDGRDPASIHPVHVRLCTQGYNLNSIESTERALRELGLAVGREHYKKGRIGLAILQESVDYFMSIIEPYVLPSYMYKVKYRSEDE